MTVAHVLALRSYLADALDDYINDAGAGVSKLRIRAGTTTVIDFDLEDPAFGVAVSGVIELNGLPIGPVAALADGVVDNAQIVDSNGDVALSCSVTVEGGGGDIEVSSVAIDSGQLCILESLTYGAAP